MTRLRASTQIHMDSFDQFPTISGLPALSEMVVNRLLIDFLLDGSSASGKHTHSGTDLTSPVYYSNDADKLDGLHDSAFGKLASANIWTENQTISKANAQVEVQDEDGNYSRWKKSSTAGKMSLVNKCLSKGALGNALDFDAVDDRVNLGDTGDLDFGTGDFSFAAWIKLAPNTNTTTIVGKVPIGSAGTKNGWGSHIHTDGTVKFFLHNNDGHYVVITSDDVVDNNAWHRVLVMANRDGNGSIIIDGGTPVTASIAAVEKTISNAIDCTIRKINFTSSVFYGDAIIIDEVIFWNKVLSGAEITADYDSGNGKYYSGAEDGFVEGYHLDESSGTDAASITGNNDGTLEGTMTDADWVTGKVTIADGDTETDVLSSEDSVTAGEKGIVKVGNAGGSVDILGRAEFKVKSWIQFNGQSGIAVQDSYNVAGIVDNGVGDYTVTWDTDFSGVDYSVVVSDNGYVNKLGTLAAGSVQTFHYNDFDAAFDPSIVCTLAIGDQ